MNVFYVCLCVASEQQHTKSCCLGRFFYFLLLLLVRTCAVHNALLSCTYHPSVDEMTGLVWRITCVTIDVHWRQALLATLYASTYAPPHPFLSLSLCFSPVIFAFPEYGQISAALQRTGSGVCVPSKAHITRLNRPTVYLHHIYTTHVDADSNRKQNGSEHRKKNKRYGSNAIKVECVCGGDDFI